MADTKDRYALAKLIDDMVSDAILAGKSEALKCLGQFTPTEGVTVSVLHRSISQKRAQLIGYFDETTTPPADAALADALCESLIEASDMRWNGDVYVGDGADLMNLVRAALRARAVPDELPLFDAAIAVELPCVSVVPYNSKEICTWFAKNVRERMLAASKAGGEV